MGIVEFTNEKWFVNSSKTFLLVNMNLIPFTLTETFRQMFLPKINFNSVVYFIGEPFNSSPPHEKKTTFIFIH